MARGRHYQDMSLVDRYDFAAGLAPEEPVPGRLQVVTLGPGEEDWAVIDEHGEVAYVGPAMFAARFAAHALR